MEYVLFTAEEQSPIVPLPFVLRNHIQTLSTPQIDVCDLLVSMAREPAHVFISIQNYPIDDFLSHSS